MSLLLKRGERGISIGHTGSGKTTFALWHLRNTPQCPALIFDTKIEPAFESVPLPDESMEIIDSGEDFIKQWAGRKQPDYLLIRPSVAEVADTDALDEILQSVYERGRSCFIYIDEAYQWHVRGQAGAGLTGILTRGRSKGMTTLLSTQRPAFVARFCFTESQKFYIYRVIDERDRKTIDAFVPGFRRCKPAERYHFWHYDVNDAGEKLLYYSPVSYIVQNKDNNPIDTNRFKWI